MAIEIEDSLRAMCTVAALNQSVSTVGLGAILIPNFGFVSAASQVPTQFISNISSTGTVITVQTDAPHNLNTGSTVYIQGVNGFTAANTTLTNITVLSATTFSAALVAAAKPYLGGGTVSGFNASSIFAGFLISSISATTPAVVTTSTPITGILQTGNNVGILYTDNASYNEKYYTITVTGASTFSLNGTTAALGAATIGNVYGFTPTGMTFITNVSNTTPVVVTDQGNPSRLNNSFVRISQTTGIPGINGEWQIQTLGYNQFALLGSQAVIGGAYAGGGIVNGSFGSQFNPYTFDVDLVLDDNITNCQPNVPANLGNLGGCAYTLGSQGNAVRSIQQIRTNPLGQSVITVNMNTFAPISLALFRSPQQNAGL